MTRTLAPRLLQPIALSLLAALALLVQCGNGDAPSPRVTALAQDPEPDEPIRLLVSGSMLGRLEPCGCASGQLGGLARRMQHIGENRSYDLLIEGGDLVDGGSELDLMKWFTAMQVLFAMQRPYDVLGVGRNDLALPLDDWCTFTKDLPVVASDLQSTRSDWPVQPFVEKTVRGRKVRIGSLTLALPATMQQPDAPVRLRSPADGWSAALAGASDDTLRIVLLHTDDSKARALIPELRPAPDLVVCCDHGYVEPSTHSELVAGVPLVFAGIRGRVLLEVGLRRTPQGPRTSLAQVPLAGSKTLPGGGGDPDVKQVLLGHRHEVKERGVLANLAGKHPTPSGDAYVGSESCRTCHPTAFAAWEKSRHFQAWDTLVKAEADPKRYGWPVTHYPDCVSCHVVGFGEKTGFVSHDETPHLSAVGCERCHGPGSGHVVSGGTKPLGILGNVQASVLCTQCHDFEQSPDFLYSTKWALIQHGREPK